MGIETQGRNYTKGSGGRGEGGHNRNGGLVEGCRIRGRYGRPVIYRGSAGPIVPDINAGIRQPKGVGRGIGRIIYQRPLVGWRI